ncbi:hypothetical protein ABIB25_002371 [Nakamurella sp. UYEF19]|uniref:hypothetical protein n=1 Tax=Nakamurella sp. UYEF19 TaxID=1756392 RepID=UPI00339661C5
MTCGPGRVLALTAVCAVLGVVGLTPVSAAPVPAAAVPAAPVSAAADSVAPNILTPQQAVDEGAATAASDGIDQYVALVDRSTGKLMASTGGDTQVVSESIVKLFTVAYYLVRYHGDLPSQMATDLHEMIVHSDDRIESQYWTTAAVPRVAQRYSLAHTANGAKTGPHDWGWEYITAADEAMFLYRASQDPMVGPFLMAAMSDVAPAGADGFDQDFGFNSLDGDHGSKQGWTDLDTSQAINIHSVGWTDRYFGAILETSPTPQYSQMRHDSTITVDLIAGLQSNAEIQAAEGTALSSAAADLAMRVGAVIRHVLGVIVPPAG